MIDAWKLTDGQRRFAAWTALLIFAVAYFPRFAKPAGIVLYSEAANCLWTEQVLQSCSLPFTYPPFFAFVMIPFVALPPLAQTVMWWAVSLGCTVLCCAIAERIAKDAFAATWTERETTLLRVGGIFLSLKFILAVYENQGFDLLALVPLLFGISAMSNRRDVAAGIGFAAAAALKVTPLIFLPYLVFKGRIKAAVVFFVALVALSFLPDLFLKPAGAPHGYLVTWIREVAAVSLFEQSGNAKLAFWDGANIFNLSIRGALARAVDGTALQADFQTILRFTQFVFIGSIGAIFLLSRKSDRSVPFESAILIISALALSPMTSKSHYVGLVSPYFLLVAACLRERERRGLYLAAAVVSFVGCTGIPRDLVPGAVTEFAVRHNSILLGALVLIVPLAVCAVRRARVAAIPQPLQMPQ